MKLQQLNEKLLNDPVYALKFLKEMLIQSHDLGYKYYDESCWARTRGYCGLKIEDGWHINDETLNSIFEKPDNCIMSIGGLYLLEIFFINDKTFTFNDHFAIADIMNMFDRFRVGNKNWHPKQKKYVKDYHCILKVQSYSVTEFLSPKKVEDIKKLIDNHIKEYLIT